MKKRILILIAVMAVLLLVAGPVYATRPIPAGGLWEYLPTGAEERYVNGHTFMTVTEIGEWSGTFDGTSTEEGTVVLHSSGFWFFKAIVSFEGQVEDSEPGTLKMRVVGSRPDALTEWEGKWVILGGTEGLATVRGRGTWSGLGWQGDPTVWGKIDYSGNVHFEPQ